ncbi:MAG: FAD-binding oxidoreductase [Ghiorsea sp.]|nr:FAD-binding oxidoreductase [Ghiorsea sp.]
MSHITVQYKGKTYTCDTDRPLLSSLLSQGGFIPYSCQGGLCQACLCKVTQGSVPKESQHGLDKHLQDQGCFYPCLCKPNEDLSIEVATKENVVFEEKGISSFDTYTSMVIDKSWLNPNTLRLCLVRPEPLQYKAGQFINLTQSENNLTRSYSLASLPCENFMELHIKRVVNGKMSNWLCDTLQLGDNITISGPSGDCYYQQDHATQDLILGGVGTGLAPLYGILRDAIESNHQGHIYLFHASLNAEGLYYQDEIKEIVGDVTNFTYIPCVLHGDAPDNGKQGAIDQIIIDSLGDCTGKRAYLCGDDAVVQSMKERLLQNGLTNDDILADAFTFINEGDQNTQANDS